MFDPKIIISPSIWWIAGGVITGIGVIIGTTVKVITRNHISRKEADEKYKDEKLCKEMHKNLNEKVKCIPEIKDRTTRIETKIDVFLEMNKNK